MHRVRKWEREVATAVYAMLREEYARQQAPNRVTLTDLSERVFGHPQSSFLVNAIERQQVPTKRTLRRIRLISPAAACVAELIPATATDTQITTLREIAAVAMTDLAVSQPVVDLARDRDVVFPLGFARARRPSHRISLLLLEIVFLRRRAGRDTILAVLRQGWFVAAAIVDCVAEFPTLRALAVPLWLEIADNFLPDIDSVKRYGNVVYLPQRGFIVNERLAQRLSDERMRLQTCVADALSSAGTQTQIQHACSGELGHALPSRPIDHFSLDLDLT